MVVGQWGFVQGSDKLFMHRLREREREREKWVVAYLSTMTGQKTKEEAMGGEVMMTDGEEGAFTPLKRCKTIYAL